MGKFVGTVAYMGDSSRSKVILGRCFRGRGLIRIDEFLLRSNGQLIGVTWGLKRQ